jgi:transposase InsO family protein
VNIYPFIEAEKAGRRNVARACALLKVSRAAFYAHLAGPSQRERADAELTQQIKAVHDGSKGRYGAPRVHAELRRRGRRHGRKRVARLMRSAGIRGRAAKRWRKTTIADPAAVARADKIRRDFTADATKINARWCGDITYIGTWEGWLYLATVIDIASRRIVGYALADHLRTELVSDALANAVAARNPGPGVVFHSDRGCQGGFNWSSQHLDLEVWRYGCRETPAGDSCDARPDVVARPAFDCAARGSGAVLGGDRSRRVERGRGGCGWRVAGRRLEMVPARWRDAADHAGPAVGAIPVVR